MTEGTSPVGYFLTVTEEFGDYVRGQIVRDADAILSILGTHPHHVVKVDAPDAPVDPAPEEVTPEAVPDQPAADAAPIPTPEA